MTESTHSAQGMRTFFIIWAGQFVSTLGSGLSNFALGVYIFQISNSATQFALVMLVNAITNLLIAPFAGALVDRWDRRWTMVVADAGNALVTMIIWLLLMTGHLSIWYIYLVSALGTILSAFQEPASTASITMLVPKENFGRASGMMQLSGAISQIVTPILAGFLVVTIKLNGILLIDLATFFVAIGTLLFIRIPRPPISAEGRKSSGSLWKEAGMGWVYLSTRPGLIGMLILFLFVNFALGFFSALLTPMILSFTTAAVLGTISSAGGIGLLIGSIVMSAWGGSKRKINSLIGSMIGFGFALSLLGLRANPWLVGLASALFFVLLPVASGSSQAIWQVKVPPDLQGRVFSVRSVVSSAARPLALAIAGPLADYVFEPGMQTNGALAGIFGPLLGTGPGRGIGLLFLFTGLFIVAANLIAYLIPRIRLVEDQIPDFNAPSQ